VETPIVYANITGYPELWQLYNETLGTHLAHPVGGKYLVYYNPVENTVFCDWERLVEGVELPTPTQPPEETPPEIPPMPLVFQQAFLSFLPLFLLPRAQRVYS